MSQEEWAIKIHNLIIKEDNTTISIDKVQEQVHKIMKTKEKIIMVIQIKDKIDLKELKTFNILQKLIREKDHLIIIQKEVFKTIIKDLIVHMEIKMIKKEDFKTEEVKTPTEKMVIFNSKKMIDALIARKRVTMQENARSLQMEIIET
jgi:hypothetical protein